MAMAMAENIRARTQNMHSNILRPRPFRVKIVSGFTQEMPMNAYIGVLLSALLACGSVNALAAVKPITPVGQEPFPQNQAQLKLQQQMETNSQQQQTRLQLEQQAQQQRQRNQLQSQIKSDQQRSQQKTPLTLPQQNP